ncbi:Hypothetical protein A7982_05089 [Minicystis rosea]|nr:Hypothetical protein A7982_05089 [Minicystis rosea]
MRHLATMVAAALIVAAGSGCGQKKLTECNALVGVINAGMVSLEKAPKNEKDPTGIADLRAMAEGMDRIATEAAAVQLTVPELKKLRDDYQKMAKEIGRAERELATAAEERAAARNAPNGDGPSEAVLKAAEDRYTARRNAADSAIEAAVKQEDPLVDQINKFCQAP